MIDILRPTRVGSLRRLNFCRSCTVVYKGKGRQFGSQQGRAVKLPSKQVHADLKKINEDAAKMVDISLLYPHVLMLHPRHWALYVHTLESNGGVQYSIAPFPPLYYVHVKMYSSE